MCFMDNLRECQQFLLTLISTLSLLIGYLIMLSWSFFKCLFYRCFFVCFYAVGNYLKWMLLVYFCFILFERNNLSDSMALNTKQSLYKYYPLSWDKECQLLMVLYCNFPCLFCITLQVLCRNAGVV